MPLCREVFVAHNKEVVSTVLLNLIRNARWFTWPAQENGKALTREEMDRRFIYVRVSRDGNEAISVEVDDHGIGLPIQVRGNERKLFEAGVRFAPSDVSMVSGGNGLFFTEQLVSHVLLGEMKTPVNSKRGGAVFGFSARVG